MCKAACLLSLIIALFVRPDCSAQIVLKVTVTNVDSKKGNIWVGIFTDEKTFLKTPAYGKTAPAIATAVSVVFDDLPAGSYAISIFHDENGNGELDTNFLGIPKEPFAFGNNAMGAFGPPSFEKAKVTLTQGETTVQEIKLHSF